MRQNDQPKLSLASLPNKTALVDSTGILDSRRLPDGHFDELWASIITSKTLKDQLLAQAVLNFTARSKLQAVALPVHGIILLTGPPGTGKTTLARGLASRTAASLDGEFTYLEVEPHALASASLGKSQQAVTHLFGNVIAEQAMSGPCIVVLDEVETLAASRDKMSLDANPVDVHRATDAVLAQLDLLAISHPSLLFIATSNFVGAIDDAFLSRADLVLTLDVPDTAASRAILVDTINRLGKAYPKIAALRRNPLIDEAANRCAGLDGRRIRKAVLSALAHSMAIAMNPELLTAEAVIEAIDQAQTERARMENHK